MIYLKGPGYIPLRQNGLGVEDIAAYLRMRDLQIKFSKDMQRSDAYVYLINGPEIYEILLTGYARYVKE